MNDTEPAAVIDDPGPGGAQSQATGSPSGVGGVAAAITRPACDQGWTNGPSTCAVRPVSVDAMTGPLEPWLQDTAELPTVAAGRRLRLLTILGTCTVVIVALCLGGLWNLNRLSNKADEPAVAAAPPPGLPTQATTPDLTFTTAPFTTAPGTAPTTTPTTASTPAKPLPPAQTVAGKPKPTKGSAAPTVTPPPGPPVQSGVRVGAPCAPRGAAGLTAKNAPVVCKPAPDGQDRWRRL